MKRLQKRDPIHLESSETEMYCICRKPAGSRFMIGCDNCYEWFHGNCIGVSPMQKLPDKWYCPKCLCDSNAKTDPAKQLHTIVDQIYTETKNLVKEVASLKVTSHSIKETIQSRDQEIMFLKEDVKQMRGQLSILETMFTRNSFFNGKEKEYGNELKKKDSQILVLQQEVFDLSGQLLSCEKIISKNSEDVDILKSKAQEYVNDLENKDNQILVLHEEVDNLTGQLLSCKGIISKNNEDVDMLKSKTQVYVNDLESKEKQIQGLQQHVDDLQRRQLVSSERPKKEESKPPKNRLSLKKKTVSQPNPSKDCHYLNDDEDFQSKKTKALKSAIDLF